MEARLEHDFMRDSWRVWITDRAGAGGARRVYEMPVTDESGVGLAKAPQFTVLSEGSTGPVPPTLELPTEWLSAIIAAGQNEAGITPPDRSMALHRDDAITVRDKMIDLVVKLAEPHVLPMATFVPDEGADR